MNKLILTDADGVLLNWEWAFRCWMTEHGYRFNEDGRKSYYLTHHYKDTDTDEIIRQIKTFNESAAIGFLPALRDATHYVKRLHEEHGYQFRVITSLSTDKNAARLREMNLKKIFGTAIESVICIATNAPKDDVLLPYKDSQLYWIEDKVENADTGHNLGLRTILMEHGHNMDHQCSYPIVKNWKEIFDIVTTSNYSIKGV
jgi:FMN phosphatase YigB (HAD superfamily)